MLARLRLLLLKTPVLVAFGGFLFYLAFGYLLFPPLAKWGAESFIASKTGHALTLTEARFDPLRLTLTLRGVQLNEPDGKPLLGFDELFVDFETRSLVRWAYTLQDIRLVAPRARLELRPDGRLNWTAFLAAFKDEEEDKDDTLPRLLVDRVALAKGQVEFVDRKVAGGFATRVEPIAFELHDLSTLPDDKGAYTLSTRTQIGARVRWRGDLALNPILATGELAVDELPLAKAWAYAGGRLNMAPPDGVAALTVGYRAGYADKHLSLLLDRLNLVLDGLALRGRAAAAPALKLDRLALSGGRFDLDQRQVRFAELALQGGHLHLQRFADGSLDVQEWFAAPGQAPAVGDTTPPPAATKTGTGSDEPGPAWKFGLDRFALDGIAVRILDAGYVQPVTLEAANARLGFKAEAELGAGEPKLSIADLQAALSGSRLASAAMPDAPVRVGDIVLESGSVDLLARHFQARRFAVLDGVVQARRGADGRINVVELLRRQAAKDTAQRLTVAAAQKAREWQYQIDSVELKGGVVAFQDDGVRPAARLTLDRIEAAVAGVSQDLRRPLPVRLGLRVKEGGQLDIAGKVTPATAALDAKVDLRGLQLAPAQPYLAQAANLSLASGQVSTGGRLRYGKALSYAGGFSVDNLLLSESATGERFLAWKALASDDLRASPDSLDIGTLRIEGLGAKLVIHADKTTNLKQILKGAPGVQPAQGDAPAAAASPLPPPTGPAKPAEAFRVGIDSIQVQNGELDFADLSLSLPFGTRIHQLKGYIHGIASQAGGAPAQLELDGLVDDYGLARASGQVNLFDPTGFMDIKTVFRNVEMTRLTPYSATFAGRRIASGKLSLDLEYKIKQRQLLGENQIIMDKLTLGERVESPTAKNLPLDLAIAILSDADGKIDLGLPVSGSLDDPEFSYGRIIWKAIVNVITKIVTAPFRALGKLLGGGAEKLESMAFDPGSARVLPPERETLKNLAQALDKRPKLGLAVQGSWDAVADRAALKENRVRAAIAKGMAVKVPEGEVAPPVPMSNAKAQEAIEALYAERLGKDALKAFKARYFKANPDQQKAADKLLGQLVGIVKGQDKPLSAEAVAALQGKALHPLLYQGLLEHEPVGDDLLQGLARQRAQAIADEMVVVNKVARERVQIGQPEAVEGDGKRVGIKLSLVVAPVPAAAAPPSGVTSPAEHKPQPAQ